MKTRILLLAATLLPVLTLQAIVDTNQNGLSDLWEKQYNGDELFSETFDPGADPDADGWTNAQEAAAGTDPFSTVHPSGYLQPETTHIPATWGDIDNDNIPDLLTPEVIQVSWPTIPGKQYTLQSNPDLAPENWIDVDASFIGTGTVVTYNFVTSAATKTFWRVNITDIDSDGDNLSDAEETQIGSNSQLLDSDGDGLADGVEMANLTNPMNTDSDEDGKEDGEDADPNENLVNWEPTIESSYILIDVETSSQESFPRDLNDRGEVLFADGIWSGGNWIPKVLPAGNGNAPSNVPYEINYGPWTHFNASGTLLGRSHLRFLEGPASGGDGVGAPVFLPSNQSSPSLILDTGDVWDPFPLSYRPHGVAADGSMTIRMDPLTVGTSQTIKRFNASGAFVGDITSNGGYEPTGSEGHGEMTASGWVASNLVRTATQTAPAAYRVGLWDASNQEKILPSLAEGWAYPVGVSDLPNEKVVLLAGKWTNETYSGRVFLPNSVGAYQAVESLSDKKILQFAGDGTALTQDHKLWRNGKLIPFRELCTRYGDLLDAEWNLHPLKANKNGVYLIQADGPNGEQETKLAMRILVEVRSPLDGPWVSAKELKVAKWEKAWSSTGQFRNDFIDSAGLAEIDRFRVRVDGDLPSHLRSIFISSSGISDPTYNDGTTEVILTKDPGVPSMGIPSSGYISKEMILVSNSTDNKFLNDNGIDDQTHIVALGSDVEFRFGSRTGSIVTKLPVKKRATVDVSSYILTPNGGIDLELVGKAYDDIRIAREIYSQIGLEVTGTVQCVSIPAGVNLNDGLLLDTEETRGILSTEDLAVLNTYGTPRNQADVIAIYVNSVINTGQTSTGECLGMAFPKGWSNADNFKGTYFLATEGDPIVWSHELGHILLNSQGGNLNNHYNLPGNLMRPTTVYTTPPTASSHQVDTRRITQEQEGYVFGSEFIQIITR